MTTTIGILGFAHGHVSTYCGKWTTMPPEVVKVVAGWDHDLASAAKGRQQFGIDLADSPTALLPRKDVSTVVIGAETSVHADLIEQAAAAGKAIVVQKPLCLTMTEADRIVAAAERAGVPFTNGIAIFRYADGSLAEVGSSFTCLAGENTTEIVGTEGVVIQNLGDAVSCGPWRARDAAGLKWFTRKKNNWNNGDIPSPAGHGERIAALAPEILKFVRGQRKTFGSAREARNSLAMTLACHESTRTDQRVRLHEAADAPAVEI